MQAPLETDAVVIGAGPVGLFQVFELGLQDVRAHLVDALPYVGGQCIELYPDKPIFDIPGVPRCTGRELVQQLQLQMQPFAPVFHGAQVVKALSAQPDGRWLVQTSTGTRLLAPTVVIAAGVGAFQPKRMQVDGLDAFEGRQVHHQLPAPEQVAGQDLVVVGDTDMALEAALQLAESAARSVTLLHRRDAFHASPTTEANFRSAQAHGRVRLQLGQVLGLATHGERLTALKVLQPDGQTVALAMDQLLVLLGLSPKLGPVAQWGLEMQKKQLQVSTETFATSAPGIFAVGDINTYPGKKKLILCGFHEATLAAFAVAAIVHPDQTIGLQYTTTSTRLHKALGIA